MTAYRILSILTPGVFVGMTIAAAFARRWREAAIAATFAIANTLIFWK